MNDLAVTEDAGTFINHYELQKQAIAKARDFATALIDQCNTSSLHELLDMYLVQQAACDADRDETGNLLVDGRAASIHLSTINQIAYARFGVQFAGGSDSW